MGRWEPLLALPRELIVRAPKCRLLTSSESFLCVVKINV